MKIWIPIKEEVMNSDSRLKALSESRKNIDLGTGRIVGTV